MLLPPFNPSFDLCLNPHYVELDTRRRKGRVDYDGDGDGGGGGDLMKQDGIGSHALPTSRRLGLAPTHDDVNALHPSTSQPATNATPLSVCLPLSRTRVAVRRMHGLWAH